MKYPFGPMTVGDILGRGFSLFFARFGLCYGIMLVVQLPLLALQLALPRLMVGGLGQLILIIPALILQMIGTGAMIHVVMQEYLGRPVTFGEALQVALGRLGGLIVTSILSGILVTLGLIACIVPGIYLAIVFSLASQVVIVENLSGMTALQRSKDLVGGHFGRVFGTLLLLGLLLGVVSFVLGLIIGVALPFQRSVNPADPFAGTELTSYPNYAIATCVTDLVQIFVQALTAICTTLLYFDLRNRKEAFDLEMEADKIRALTERFRPRSYPGSSDIQQADEGIQPRGPAAEPRDTGIRPDAPPPGAGPAP
jgi:hypothetical protein